MILGIYIGNRKIDLFDNENIELKSSVADISDITKQNTDYTKSFTVPASDNNNITFKHYYNADVDNSFDARTKVDGYIELDGIPFKVGKFRLEKVAVKSGRPSNYAINFWGKTVTVKDKVKDDELSSLPLSEFDHVLSSANVIEGLRNQLFGGSIIYTPISKRQWYYNSDPADNVNTDTLANIAFNGGTVNGIRYNEIKPSIKLISIIEAIESKYNIQFSRDFFGREEFNRLYLWLNNNKEILPVPTEQKVNFTSGDAVDFGLDLSTDVWSNSSFRNSNSDVRWFRYRLRVNPTTSLPYKIVIRNFGQVIYEQPASGYTEAGFGNIYTNENAPFEYSFHISSSYALTYESILDLIEITDINSPYTQSSRTGIAPSNSIVSNFIITDNMPKLKVSDFLTGLFKLFKLVVVPTDTDEVYVNSLNDYYASGTIYDITPYVDMESYEVNRGKILNTLDFKFQDPTTILNAQFKKNNAQGYGDDLIELADENGELLDGDKLEVSVPFEQIVYERLRDLNDDSPSNIAYGLATDESLDPVNPKAHIFYRNNTILGDYPVAVVDDTGTTVNLGTTINNVGHTMGFSSPLYSMIFGREFSIWDSSLITNTLYSNYYSDYVNAIFNIKKRNFNFSSILPLSILSRLKLNDVLKIQNSYYRINDYVMNLITNEVRLNLINSFDNNISNFIANQDLIFFGINEFRQSVYFSLVPESFSSTDTWISLSIEGNNLFIDVDENLTGEERTGTVVAEKDVKGKPKSITIVIVQE